MLKESNAQVEAMCRKLNGILLKVNAGFILDIRWIKNTLTKGMFRERHLAKALRLKVYETCENDEEKIKTTFSKIFGGKELKSLLNDVAGVENEIRGILLKAGGGAFVPEDPKAFLPLKTVAVEMYTKGMLYFLQTIAIFLVPPKLTFMAIDLFSSQ